MNYRNSLLRALETNLAPVMFRCLPHLSQYRRVTEAGFHCVILSVGGALPATADLQIGIRLDIVEQLVYQFTTGLSGYGLHSTTLLVSSGRLLGQPYQRYTLEHPSDVHQVAQAMNDFMESDGFAFFRNYDSIAALDELYNASDTRWLPHLNHRSLRGIILAKLAHRDGWPELAANYRAQLQQRGTPEAVMNKYEQLVSYLRHFSVN